MAVVSPSKGRVLAKAVLKAASDMGLTSDELTKALNLSQGELVDLKKHQNLDLDTISGERALLLLRCTTALNSITGNDLRLKHSFLHSPNRGTKGVPAEQIQHKHGLHVVVQYLEAMLQRC